MTRLSALGKEWLPGVENVHVISVNRPVTDAEFFGYLQKRADFKVSLDNALRNLGRHGRATSLGPIHDAMIELALPAFDCAAGDMEDSGNSSVSQTLLQKLKNLLPYILRNSLRHKTPPSLSNKLGGVHISGGPGS